MVKRWNAIIFLYEDLSHALSLFLYILTDVTNKLYNITLVSSSSFLFVCFFFFESSVFKLGLRRWGVFGVEQYFVGEASMSVPLMPNNLSPRRWKQATFCTLSRKYWFSCLNVAKCNWLLCVCKLTWVPHSSLKTEKIIKKKKDKKREKYDFNGAE